MAFEIVIGRSKKDIEKYGKRGTIFLGKQYVQMGAVRTLANEVYLDVASSHVVFVCGKRGGGKSYTMGVIAEGIANLPPEIKQNLSVIMLDTMGVYWTMKYPNHKDMELLKEWGLEPIPLDVKIFTPSGFYDGYKKKGIPTDAPFAIKPADLNPEDWCMTFGIDPDSPAGVLISQAVHGVRDKQGDFSLQEIMDWIQKFEKVDEHVKNVVIGHFHKTEDWGIFSKEGTLLKDLAKGGQVTVLDVSAYATLPSGWAIKSLVVGLISKKLFNERMVARKEEEFSSIDVAMHYFAKETKEKLEEPLVWLVIDEAHEMLPHEGKTTASDALITILREGRQPGISLILASQQPGKIHTDVMTQSDTVISHRLTAKIDVEALEQISQTYTRGGIAEKLNILPGVKGSAIVFDDMNEKVFPIQVRPRFTWHGGAAPTAIVEKVKRL
ncbi:ATP-binding protein [Candidatus Woesearchaeota archaeon]|nr:ATP-binding protein [Candidatus Woesearchaeota archaeon]